MNNIKKSIQNLLSVKNDQELLTKFCKEKYNDRFPGFPKYGFQAYDGFEIINENQVRINYLYGVGEIEYNDSFTIELTV